MTLQAPATTQRETLAELLASLDGTPGAYLRVAREIAQRRASFQLRPVSVALVSTFTIEVLTPYLTVEAARRGFSIDVTVAPYGQLEQSLLDATHAVYAARPDVVILATRLEDAAPSLGDGFVALSPTDVGHAIDGYVARVEGLVRAVRERASAEILVWNQPPTLRVAAGLADTVLEPSQSDAVAEVNRRLGAVCRGVAGAHVFDVARLVTEVGVRQWFDPKLWFLARIPFGATAQVALAGALGRHLRALLTPPAKCLVLDLDNTLWGGVLGEDGIGGIALGDEYPGNVFKAFQRQVRSYRDRGVLLAVASKNDEADVLECFKDHADMILHAEDFAARQIHWGDKATSLLAIAGALGIDTSALVFFDDNPVERDWVRSQMPEVHVVDVPRDPMRYGVALDASGAFDHLVITDDDRRRPELYRREEQRRELGRRAGSVDAFLQALEMKVTVGSVDASTLPRVAQLLGKTNQFNVTTRRHSQADIERMIADGAIALWMRVEDRHGDHGLVGVAIAVPEAGSAHRVDTFLLSCRILGRRAEDALLSSLASRAAARGSTTLLGEFIPTRKNEPAAAFFPRLGFAPVAGRDGFWSLDLSGGPPSSPELSQVVDRP